MAIKALTSSGWHEEKAVYDQFQTYIKNDLDMLQEQSMENMKRENLAEVMTLQVEKQNLSKTIDDNLERISAQQKQIV